MFIALVSLALGFAFAQQVHCPYSVEQSFAHFEQRFGARNPVKSVAELQTAEMLMFGHLGFADADVPYLCPLTGLKSLYIYNDADGIGKMEGKTLEYLSTLQDLVFLDLDGNQISARELFRLKGLKSLKQLKLGIGNPLGNEGMTALDQLPALESLVLQRNAMTPADVRWMGESRKIWKQIALLENPDLGNSALPAIAKGRVKSLDLRQTGIRDARGFEYLARNPDLEELILDSLPGTGNVNALKHLLQSQSLSRLYMPLKMDRIILSLLIGFSKLNSISLTYDPALSESERNQYFRDLFKQSGISQVYLLVDVRFYMSPESMSFCQKLLAEFPQQRFFLNSANFMPRACEI